MNFPALSRRAILAASLGALARAVPLTDVHLGVSTDEIDEDPAVAGAFLERFHVRYAEVRNLWGKYNTDQPAAKIEEAKAAFAAHKVTVQVLDTAFFRKDIPADGAALDAEWTTLDSAMDRARIFGSRVLRIFAFLPKDRAAAGTPLPPRAVELLNEAAARASKRGFRLAVENLLGSYVQNGADAARMLKAVKSPDLGLTWDPNNAASSGEKSFPDGYRQLDPARIFNIHLRDYKSKPGGGVDWAAVGTGEFDNLGQIRALRRDGYKGPFTLETHWRHPNGKAYATEVSLTALLKVIENV